MNKDRLLKVDYRFKLEIKSLKKITKKKNNFIKFKTKGFIRALTSVAAK